MRRTLHRALKCHKGNMRLGLRALAHWDLGSRAAAHQGTGHPFMEHDVSRTVPVKLESMGIKGSAGKSPIRCVRRGTIAQWAVQVGHDHSSGALVDAH